jgi:outer membrane protein insertion porin family
VITNTELLFPPPFAEQAANFRVGLFFDAGNVFGDVSDFETSEIRTSAGVTASWITPVGALTFSLGQALNAQSDDPNQPGPQGDDTEIFQFNIGTVF